jgi:hypothetical protein
VLQPSHCFCLGAEAGAFAPVSESPAEKHFQSHDALKLQVPGLIDYTHATPTQLPEDRVARNRRQVRYCSIYHRASQPLLMKLRKTRGVVCYDWMLAVETAVDDIQVDQFTQQGRALLLGHIAEKILNVGPFDVGTDPFPGGLKPVTEFVCSLQPGRRHPLIARAKLIAHSRTFSWPDGLLIPE